MQETSSQAITQAGFEGFCQWVHSVPFIPRSPSPPASGAVPVEKWLATLEGLTCDRPSIRSLVPGDDVFSVDEPAEDLDMTSSSESIPPCNYTVPQQLLPFVTKNNFETCRSTYFEHASELTDRGPRSPSKSQRGVACDYFPDYKCKQSPYPVITTCAKVPSCSLCSRCGSLGDHTMVHCLGCCDVYHFFCAHLPERLVPRLTTWFCHRCAVCAICSRKELTGYKFVSDIIDTCYRCQKQYHVNCNKITNFNLIHRESAKQLRVCNPCLFQSTCKKCRSVISPDDIFRECSGLSPYVCVECRDIVENDLCRQCALDSQNQFRKVVCENCRDVYHCHCLCDTDRSRLATGLSFLCSGCVAQSSVIPPPQRWTAKTGRRLLDALRLEVIQHMNTTYSCSDKSPRKSNASSRRDFCRALSHVLTNADVGNHSAQAVSATEDAVISESSAPANLLDEDAGLYQPSPDSGVGLSGSETEGVAGSSDSVVDSTPPSSPTKAATSFHINSHESFSASPRTVSKAFGPATEVTDDPVFFLDRHQVAWLQRNFVTHMRTRCDDCKSGSHRAAGQHAELLKAIADLTENDCVCSDSKQLASAVRGLVSLAGFSSTLPKKMEARFIELGCQTVPTVDQPNKTVNVIARRSIFPVLRRGSEPPPALVPSSYRPDTTTLKFRVLDARICLLCSVAGDYSNCESGGRLLYVGHDVFAHIGCLWFACSKKRVLDYMVYKLSNLESVQFRRNECAVCPLPLGVLGCAQKRCHNSYHLNCAVGESCFFSHSLVTNLPAVVCPIHKIDDFNDELLVKTVRQADIERSFIEMPIFARSPPTNVQNIGNPGWSTGVRREDVNVHLGGAFIEELGRLARGWETRDILIPCGFQTQRVFWSSVTPHHLARYKFFTFDMVMQPSIKALICAILHMEDLPSLDYLKQRKEERLKSMRTVPGKSVIDDLWRCEDGETREATDTSRQMEGCSEATVQGPSAETLVKAVSEIPTDLSADAAAVVPLVAATESHTSQPVVSAAPVVPARSRSNSPEFPVTAPCRAKPQAKRSRTPSISPRKGTKRSTSYFTAKAESVHVMTPKGRLSSVGDSEEDSSTTAASPKDSEPFDPLDSAGMELFPSFPPRRSTRSNSTCSLSPEFLPIEPPRFTAAEALKSSRNRREPTGTGRSAAPGARRNVLRSAAVSPDCVQPSPGKVLKSGRTVMLVEPTKILPKSPVGTSKNRNASSAAAGSGVQLYLAAPGKPLATACAGLKSRASIDQWNDLAAAVQNPSEGPVKRKKGRPPKNLVLPPAVTVFDAPSALPSPGPSSPVDVNIEPSGYLFLPRKSARLGSVHASPGESVAPVENPVRNTGLRSCLKRDTGETVRSSPRKVKFDKCCSKSVFEPLFNVLHPYMVEPNVEPRAGPYFPPTEEFDSEPDYLAKVKYKARIEVARMRRHRMDELMGMIKTSDLTRLSKEPQQMCVLLGSDGFFAASHWPEDLVSHLYDDIQRNRRANGLQGKSSTGPPIRLAPGEFVGLAYPVIRFLLEQLPVSVNTSSIYSRKFFTKEALKARPKIELKPSGPVFLSRREPTCTTCPFPLHCFSVVNGRTYTKTPVVERQVVFKWKAAYKTLPEDKDPSSKLIRIFNSSYVDPTFFPEWYEDIRHDEKQTFVLSYALHPHENTAYLALIAKKNYAIGMEVKFDPQREPRRAINVLGVENFSCSKHHQIL